MSFAFGFGQEPYFSGVVVVVLVVELVDVEVVVFVEVVIELVVPT